MKHFTEYRCHNDSGRPHSVSEKGKRIPMRQSSLNCFVGTEGYPDTAVGDYVVYVECVRCGRGAKINKDGYVLERINSF